MADAPAFPDITDLRYEDAREELIAIVAKLEAGQAPLEDSMQLWRRGEALAAHCQRWLDGAQAEIERTTQPTATATSATSSEDDEVHADNAVFDDEDD
ncbi:MAG: exodeoxyribonuclease VII small subunit [Intrasporangium sp.]|uniref:exodeoxyribonuclease VII small subunit n=1 Tax=Intrasporangium sp. TaxID=1925024 RepID=UPI003F816AB4